MSFRPVLLGEMRERVKARDWTGAKRIALTLGLCRDTPQALFEYDEDYLKRLARIARKRSATARESHPAPARARKVA